MLLINTVHSKGSSFICKYTHMNNIISTYYYYYYHFFVNEEKKRSECQYQKESNKQFKSRVYLNILHFISFTKIPPNIMYFHVNFRGK